MAAVLPTPTFLAKRALRHAADLLTTDNRENMMMVQYSICTNVNGLCKLLLIFVAVFFLWLVECGGGDNKSEALMSSHPLKMDLSHKFFVHTGNDVQLI